VHVSKPLFRALNNMKRRQNCDAWIHLYTKMIISYFGFGIRLSDVHVSDNHMAGHIHPRLLVVEIFARKASILGDDQQRTTWMREDKMGARLPDALISPPPLDKKRRSSLAVGIIPSRW
jgi:hypothetical protein